MTPLEKIIRELIITDGPMPIDRYMALCLGHPQYGYYMTRDPFGAAGDFTTAPEISQVFGELIGIWVAQVWQLMGSPSVFSLVELGPGRGTLMKDILRATVKTKGFSTASEVHFVETSPTLRKAQSANIPHAKWHDSIATLPAQPLIIIANEFFDAIPIRQFEIRNNELFERCVSIESDHLAFGLKPTGQNNLTAGQNIYETSPARAAIARDLAAMIAHHAGAAIIIDYGHKKSANGDTLQAMKNHAPCSLFETPGEADITSHVDFEQLLKALAHNKTTALPLLTQGEFLNAMGLQLRTEALARNLSGDDRENLLKASHRLANTTEMGQLFKVAAITHHGMATPFPFGSI